MMQSDKLNNHVEQLITLFSDINISEPVCHRIACDLIELDRLGIDHAWKKPINTVREAIEQEWKSMLHGQWGTPYRVQMHLNHPGLMAIIFEYNRIYDK